MGAALGDGGDAMSDMDYRNYRVGTCGWPVACFGPDGEQLYTPQELEARGSDYCPVGVCMPGRGHQLTGEYSHAPEDRNWRTDHAYKYDPNWNKAEQPNSLPNSAPKSLPDGGEWVRIGEGIEIRQPAAVPARHWWDLITR
jgi:hypothetical protein